MAPYVAYYVLLSLREGKIWIYPILEMEQAAGMEQMKVIIAGPRDLWDRQAVERGIREGPFPISEVVCGDAKGIDTVGAQWAADNDIPVKHFPADWGTHGKRAGFMRNAEMAEYADALIAVDVGSPGTANMIRQMEARKGRHNVWRVRPTDWND